MGQQGGVMARGAGPEQAPLTALAQAGSEEPLLKKILTASEFGSHITEVTFPGPVVLTTARVGAVPSSAAQQQQTQLLLFAQDAGTPASARFLQLCAGFEQPASGTRVVQLQPCVTTKVLLRGSYQTVPLALYGYSLEAAAAAAPPLPQRRLTLNGALQWLRQQQQQQQQQQQEGAQPAVPPAQPSAAGEAACWSEAPLQAAVQAVLGQLVGYWELVGTSERLMALHPPPTAAFKAASAVADAVCGQLAAGSFGREPLPVPLLPAAAAAPQQAAGGDVATADVQQQQQVLEGEALLDAAADMVMGWCGMLGAGAAMRTNAAVRCSMAGLAAAVLLCSCGEGARMVVARWGVVLLDDVLTMPGAPPSFARYSATTCLLIARCCGTLGAASLLGLWKPARGIVWRSARRQQQLEAKAAAAVAAAAAAGEEASAAGSGEHAAAAAEGGVEAAADMEEDDEAAAAAVAAELEEQQQQQQLYPMQSDEEDEAAGEEEAAEAAAAGEEQEERVSDEEGLQGTQQQQQSHEQQQRDQWQQEQQHDEQLLYGDDSGDDEQDFPGYADGVPHEEEQEEEEQQYEGLGGGQQAGGQQQAEEEEQQQGLLDAAPVSDEQQQQQAGERQQAGSAAAPAAAVAMDEDEFGADVYDDLAPAHQPAHAAPASGAAAPLSASAPAAGGGADDAGLEDEDDLYGDLGGDGSTIPQTDGAADSPPRRRRRSGAADPGERWEMGGSEGADGDGNAPVKERSSRRKHRSERSSERGGKHRKSRRERERSGDRSQGRSHERGEGRRERGQGEDERQRRDREAAEQDRTERAERERAERERAAHERSERHRQEQLRREADQERQRRQEEEEQQRRQRRRQEEEEQRRQRRQEEERRRQQQEEEQRRRRYQEQQRRLEEEQRQVEQEERRRAEQEQRRRVAQEEQRQKQQEEQRQQQQQRKRERSPAGTEGQRGGEPGGKQQRTSGAAGRRPPPQPQQQGSDASRPPADSQRQQLEPAARHAAAGAAAGPEHAAPAPARFQPGQQRLQRPAVAPAAAAAPPLDEAGKWVLHERQQLRRMKGYWLLKQHAYAGCSQHVAQHLLEDVQPQRLVLITRQLLHMLRAHEAAATFQAAAEDLVRAHRQQQQQQPPMPTPELSLLVADCSSSLQQLTELLAKPLATSSGSSSSGPAAPARPAALDPPPALLEAVSSRRLLPLLAAVLHVPMAHRAQLEQQLLPPQQQQQQAVMIEAAVQQQLAVGAKALLTLLASSSSGRQLLLRDAAVVEQLLLATDASCLAAGWQPAAGAQGASMLQHLLIAEATVSQLCSSSLESEAFAVAADTAAALLQDCGSCGRHALLQALALRGQAAVPRLLLMLRMHCALLRAACGTGAASGPSSSAAQQQQQQYEPDFELLLAAAPACAPAGQLLLALMTATHPGLLASWQHHAVAVQVAASTELRQLAALPPAAAAVVGGLGAAKSQLASLKGAVAAVMTLQQQRGLSSLLTYLGAELPALLAAPAAPAAGAAAEEGDAPPGPAATAHVRTVRWGAVETLFCDPEKLACCEQCLQLVASLLWVPAVAGRLAAHTADAEEALSVLLRSVLTGAELAVASAADDSWQALAGHSIDVGEAAACRRRALSFLGAAAAAMSCLLQHLRGSTCPVKSPSLLAGLLRAHSALCCQEESLACMLGGSTGEGAATGATLAGAAGLQGVLVARYHLASCLRCYVEAAQPWQPPLLQQVFWGTPSPGLEPGQVAAQTPAEMFAAACLLGDIFPAEWPAAGRKATQAPPSDRKYRAALATAIEPCGASFRRLIAAALTSESRLLRAAVVRVLARAAGLGGGMGPFLVEPLLEELQTVAESPAPLHDARRLLEVIVPLVYRPALKSAMLAAPFTSTLAQLLGVVVSKLSSGDEGSEALHVCTMAMEAVVVLFNHEVCLNPLASREQQQLDDMPPLAEAVPMARALLELLPGMGANAMIAHRVLRLMAAADSGRLALRRAVVDVHAAASGGERPSGNPGSIAVAQAAQWVANRYWAAAERLGGGDAAAVAAGGLEGLRSVYTDIVNIMQQICIAVDEDGTPKASSAQHRFVAALQAALQAAAGAGLDVGGDEHRWEAAGSAEAQAADLVHDPATRMFWRNVRARAATQSQASSAHAMRRFARRECQADPSISLESSLHPPLTLPRQVQEQPPAMEQQAQQRPKAQPRATQPADVKASSTANVMLKAEQWNGQADAASAGTGPTTAAIVTQPAAAGMAATAAWRQQSTQQSMDLYADLDLQAAGSGHGSKPATSVLAHLQRQQPRPLQAQTGLHPQAEGEAAGGPVATQFAVRHEQAPSARLQPALPAAAADTAVGRQPPESATPGSLQALLASPTALQTLLKDPAQLQRLLEKHPALISVLKSTLGRT